MDKKLKDSIELFNTQYPKRKIRGYCMDDKGNYILIAVPLCPGAEEACHFLVEGEKITVTHPGITNYVTDMQRIFL